MHLCIRIDIVSKASWIGSRKWIAFGFSDNRSQCRSVGFIFNSKSWKQFRLLYNPLQSILSWFAIRTKKKGDCSSGIEWYVLYCTSSIFRSTFQPNLALQRFDCDGGCWQRLTNRRDNEITDHASATSTWKLSKLSSNACHRRIEDDWRNRVHIQCSLRQRLSTT